MNPGSIFLKPTGQQEDHFSEKELDDVIVHVSSQPDLETQEKMDSEPIVPEFVTDLKNKYGEIDFTIEE